MVVASVGGGVCGGVNGGCVGRGGEGVVCCGRSVVGVVAATVVDVEVVVVL